MKVNATNNLPFYLQIRNDLKTKIESGEWKEGTLIPTEKELSEMYGVSRVTIRSAIKELVNEQYLIRRPGFGTMVYQNKESLSNFTLIRSFTNEMREMGLTSHTIEARLEMIFADQKLSQIFNIKEGDPIYNLKRVRGDKIPILYSNTYLLPVTEITDEVLHGSLYQYLAKKQVFFDHFEESISAVKAPREITSLLRIYSDAPQLKRVRFSYDENNRLVEYTENFYNSLLYEYRTSIRYRKR